MTKLIDDAPDAIVTPADVERNDYMARRPFVYHPPTDSVYIGAPGEHHGIVYDRHGIPHNEIQHCKEGYIFQHSEPVTEPGVGWYKTQGLPENHQEILESMSGMYGVPVERNIDSDWDFSG